MGGGGWRGVAGEFREVGSVPGEGVGGRCVGEWGFFLSFLAVGRGPGEVVRREKETGEEECLFFG